MIWYTFIRPRVGKFKKSKYIYVYISISISLSLYIYIYIYIYAYPFPLNHHPTLLDHNPKHINSLTGLISCNALMLIMSNLNAPLWSPSLSRLPSLNHKSEATSPFWPHDKTPRCDSQSTWGKESKRLEEIGLMFPFIWGRRGCVFKYTGQNICLWKRGENGTGGKEIGGRRKRRRRRRGHGKGGEEEGEEWKWWE